jgi:hypothetical protein
MDEESMHPNYFGRSAVRRILREAAQPGADVKQVISKYFPDDAIEALPGTSEFLSHPSPITGLFRDAEVAVDDSVVESDRGVRVISSNTVA